MSPIAANPSSINASVPRNPGDLLYGREDVLSEIDRRLDLLVLRSRKGAVLLVR